MCYDCFTRIKTYVILGRCKVNDVLFLTISRHLPGNLFSSLRQNLSNGITNLFKLRTNVFTLFIYIFIYCFWAFTFATEVMLIVIAECTSAFRMRRSFIRGSSISSILIPQILPFTPHCSYISANPLISRTHFFDIRILGPHKFSCLYWNVVHLERVVYL